VTPDLSMSDSEWFYIVNNGVKKDEQIRDVRGNLLPSHNDSFTIPGHVPIVSENPDKEVKEDV
jgi:hypothetical protein